MQQDNAPRRRKRLSADLPQHWLHDPKFWLLSSDAWRLHTHALMWAIGRTDGEIPAGMLPMLLPGSETGRQRAAEELVTAGHWADSETGWLIPDWDQHQSTVQEIDNNRRRERDKKRRQRGSELAATTSVPEVVPPGTPVGESTGGVRNGTERHVKEEVLGGSADETKPCDGCGKPTAAWVLGPRNGRCISCARAAKPQ